MINDFSSSPVGVLLTLLLLLLVIAWILLPFAVFGLKERADRIIEELTAANRTLRRLAGDIDHSEEPTADQRFGPSGERLG